MLAQKFMLDAGKYMKITPVHVSNYVGKMASKLNIQPVLDYDNFSAKVFSLLKEINTVHDIDEQIIATASGSSSIHPSYDKIGLYILIRDLHNSTHSDFRNVAKELYNNYVRVNEIDMEWKHSPIVSQNLIDFVEKHHERINREIDYTRDFDFTMFGYRTLQFSYLKKTMNKQNKIKITERPQHLFMRVAIGIHMHKDDIESVIETYHYMSKMYFTHATPTLYNAGTIIPQLSSCFLLGLVDKTESLGKSWSDCALISMFAGGIGINVSNIRATGSYINSTQGKASGLKFLKVYNEIARTVNQGGKRPGSFAMYLEPWHADIHYFLKLKKNSGQESDRARDLFLALFINDLFMERIISDGMWSLMCPSECPGLVNSYGQEQRKLYEMYESKKTFRSQVKARELWNEIVDACIEGGIPYILNKDSINTKSNQKNYGVISCSNLCAEIVEYSDEKEYAVCNLASISLPKFIVDGKYDFEGLGKIVRIITRNLNNIIDINFYPVPETKLSNMRHRPIGVGVQGLADTFIKMKMPFDSEEARKLNAEIFECIYYHALCESNRIAMKEGPYETFQGSPFSKGMFQFDLWKEENPDLKIHFSGRYDWDELRQRVIKYGVRNSQLTTAMPTASTSQIMGNNECFEPYTSNLYVRETQAGTFKLPNKHMIEDLIDLGIWNEDIINRIAYNRGSIKNIKAIPDHIKQIYRTVWEIPQKSLIEMSADRGCFIDQTQSLNLFIKDPTHQLVTSCIFKGWKLRLKTCMYYLRTRPAVDPIQFGLSVEKIKEYENEDADNMVCMWRPSSLKEGEKCLVCTS